MMFKTKKSTTPNTTSCGGGVEFQIDQINIIQLEVQKYVHTSHVHSCWLFEIDCEKNEEKGGAVGGWLQLVLIYHP